ncbi:MAG: CARDB domain-containing protein, partial [Candidatus Nanohaloarchaea archaeon]
GRPQFRIMEVNSTLVTGGTGKIVLEVKNTGSVESGSTRVRVLDSSDLPFSFDSASRYVGTLQPGQTGTAVFTVTTEAGAVPKNYLLDFEVRGVKDTQVFVADRTIELEVGKGASSSTPVVPVVAALLVLGGAAYLFRDRLRQALPI